MSSKVLTVLLIVAGIAVAVGLALLVLMEQSPPP